MPAHTSSPPAYRGEALFWDEMLQLDDGKLHLWYDIVLGPGLEFDLLLADLCTGVFCIEIKSIELDQIKLLEVQSLTRRDGAVCPSPFGQAIVAIRALGATLDKTWEDRPDLLPVAAFPLITRDQWIERYMDDDIGEYAHRCILKDDLETIDTLRIRLNEIAQHPLSGRPRNPLFTGLPTSVPDTLHQTLYSQTATSLTDARQPTPDSFSLLDEVIALVKGPGAAYQSPGADSLTLWRAALSASSERLRVSVVGEFKSGKSSLINAIVGRNVCYVDEFEATTISATYTDAAEEAVEILDDQNETQTYSIEAFLDRCEKKDLESAHRVTVSLPTGLPFDLVDSPGLGSYTQGRTEEAEWEIRRTDLLLWTVDCNDAGSAREGAFIHRARDIGLPIIVLLTKSDSIGVDEVQALIDYVAGETGISVESILPVSSNDGAGLDMLKDRLKDAASRKAEFQTEAHRAKTREAIDGSRSTLRFLIEINAPHARFVALERGYLETSALGIGLAAKSEWLRVLRDECSQVATNIASKEIDDTDVVQLMLQKALPGALNQATTRFFQSLRRLVRDEWRSALEERSREFEERLADLLIQRPEAKADLDFLREQSEAFRLRAEIIDAESQLEPAAIDNRLLIVGLGAAASVVMVSILPIAVAGVVAAVAMRERKISTAGGPKVDPIIAGQIEGAILSSFESVAEPFERAIDQIVTEVAMRSLIKLVNRRGGPEFQTIVTIERKASDLMDELAAIRIC